MKKDFVSTWKRSVKKSKQRKYRFNSPLHIKQKFVHSQLSKDLRKKYNKRSLGLRKGDKVKIEVGDFKGKEGKVERVDLKKTFVYINGIERTKKDGSKVFCPIHPSNVIILDLVLDDKKRQKILERKNASKK